jgi:streptomycin 6-kinase
MTIEDLPDAARAGVVERVSTGLLCTQIDLQPAGREMLAAADRVSRQEAGSPAVGA